MRSPPRSAFPSSTKPQAAAPDDAGDDVADGRRDAAAADDVEPSAEHQSPAAAPPGRRRRGAPASRGERAGRGATRRPRGGTTGGARSPCSGAPAAVLHTDGLWLSDGTRVELTEPIVHVGQVAELAYSHHIGYQLTAEIRRAGPDLDHRAGLPGLRHRRRGDQPARPGQVAAPAHRGHRLRDPGRRRGVEPGRGGEDPNAHRLGTWTRVYRERQARA